MKRTQRVTFGKVDDASGDDARRNGSESHVITLCSVPVPITIRRPRSPLLTRFSFFSSRRHDHWRHCYWLHMGYFSTRAEAQRWVEILLPHYPNAFVDEMRKLIPHAAADEQDGTDTPGQPMEQDVGGLCQGERTTLNSRSDLS